MTSQIETSAKERDLDEPFDALVCRPLGKMVAKWAVRADVSANQMSGLAGLCGFGAGCFRALAWPYPALGGLLLFLMTIFDCADGEIARLTGGGGWKGRLREKWPLMRCSFG